MRSVVSVLAATCLLAGATAGALAAQTDKPAPKLNYAAMNKMGWKLSCQAWTFREMTLFETIDRLKSLGIKYIEMYPGQPMSPENRAGFDSNASPEMVAAVQAKLKEAGITPVNYGVCGLSANEAEDRKVFDFAKKLGLVTIVSEPGEDAMPVLDKLTEEYKINVAIHDHPKPSHYWNPDTVLAAINGHSNRIGSCSDTGHWYRSGLVPVECLKKLKGHIISLHFKDLNADKVDQPWGTGVGDAMGQLTELKDQKFKGVFSIEYESGSGQELYDNVAKCVQFFSGACGKLAKR